MLDRNRRIKAMPERFQETAKQFDVIFTTEERIYDAVVESESLFIPPATSVFLSPLYVLSTTVVLTHIHHILYCHNSIQ